MLAACAGLALMIGCTPTTQREALEAYAPADRIRAIEIAAEAGDPGIVPALVDRLDDEEVAVRMAAIDALERITGKTLGFVPWAPPVVRRAVVENWRAFVRSRALAQEAAHPT